MTDLPLSPDDVADIVAILDSGNYDKLDISTARFRLRIAREGEGWAQDWDFSASSTTIAEDHTPAPAVLPEGILAVTAPLPGTFYRAPQPGAADFVKVGDRVTVDTVIGIIETMKLMNPVHAGHAGTVAEIVTNDATMIESGAVLMCIREA